MLLPVPQNFTFIRTFISHWVDQKEGFSDMLIISRILCHVSINKVMKYFLIPTYNYRKLLGMDTLVRVRF